MNYSPLNDPEFQKYRKEAHEKAAAARRKRTLIILFVVAALSLISVGLLTAAALEVAPKVIEQYNPPENTLPDLPPITLTEPESEQTPGINTTLPPGMRATTVYIDAGHGFLSPSGTAIDSGAGVGTIYTSLSEEQTGSALYEADLNLAIAKKARDLLRERGYSVIMSREDYVNQALSITARAEKVNRTDADVLVSVHANSTKDTAVSGARIYYCDRADYGAASENLANAVANAINEAGASSREATVFQNRTLVMINSTRLPSILVETCFLTNEEDAAAALTEEWQNAMAGAIASAIMEQFPLEYTNA